MLPDAVDTTPSLELHLEPGDRIVLYTDGITEVFNSRGEMLGIEGIREIVHQTSTLPAQKWRTEVFLMESRPGGATRQPTMFYLYAVLVHVD